MEAARFSLRHLAWQMYLVSFLLFASTTADVLASMSAQIYQGHVGLEGTFEFFVAELSAQYASQTIDASALANTIVSIAEWRFKGCGVRMEPSM